MTDYLNQPEQPSTGQPAPPPYAALPGQPVPGYPVSVAQYPVIMLPQHPQAVTILVLGIVGYFTFVTAPIAWVLGHRAEKEMAASGQRFANESYVKVGKLLGMIFTIVGALSVLALIAYFIFLFSLMMSVFQSFPR